MTETDELEAADAVVITATIDSKLLALTDDDGAAEVFMRDDPETADRVEAARKLHGESARAMSITEFRALTR